jgi:MoaA/NifB/PqqE/SkfB family radical SAM enzyme
MSNKNSKYINVRNWYEKSTEDIKMITNKNKDVICAAPWSHLYIDTGGLVRPCCTSDIVYGDSNTTPVTDIWQSQTAINFRKNLIKGITQPGCKFCYNQEKHSGSSLRSGLNVKYGDMISNDLTPEMIIKYLDIRSSNLCNMACVMCGSEYSSNWYADEVSMGNHNDNDSKKKFINITKKTENDIIENIISNNIDLVYFAGGEPLITPYHYKLVETMIDRGLASNIELRYNTNLSTLKYKSIDITERWSHFKAVEVSPSIDMIGAHAEYHRYGTDWKQISANLHTIRFDMPQIKIVPQITITALSIGYLPDLLTFFIEELKFTDDDHISFNLAQYPFNMNVNILPISVKKLYTKKLESFLENVQFPDLCESIITSSITAMNDSDDENNTHANLQAMTDYLDQLDELRGNDWKSLWPELWGPV